MNRERRPAAPPEMSALLGRKGLMAGDIVEVLQIKLDGILVRETWVRAVVVEVRSNGDIGVLLGPNANAGEQNLLALPAHERGRLWR